MNKKSIAGVILAGGKGTRMAPFSTRYPKPVLPVCNRPLMDYHLEVMRNLGIQDIFILIGHLGYEIVRTVSSCNVKGLNIQYIEQNEILGIAHALGQMQNYITTPFLMFLGDIFFRTVGLEQAVSDFKSDDSSCYLVAKNDTPEAVQKNFAIITDDNDGRVKKVIEKPRYTDSSLKGCGLYLFDLHIFDAIRRTPRTAMRDEYELTDSIQILINDGEKVMAASVVEEDINLTTPYDLLSCNLLELSHRGLDNLVDETAVISSGADLANCIVGAGSIINGPVKLENCVVFQGSRIDTIDEMYIRNHIITPDVIIECRPPLSGASRKP